MEGEIIKVSLNSCGTRGLEMCDHMSLKTRPFLAFYDSNNFWKHYGIVLWSKHVLILIHLKIPSWSSSKKVWFIEATSKERGKQTRRLYLVILFAIGRSWYNEHNVSIKSPFGCLNTKLWCVKLRKKIVFIT